MAKFCKNCGTKLDENTGLCPRCDGGSGITGPNNRTHSEQTLTKKELKKKKKADKKLRKKEKREKSTKIKKIRKYFLKLVLYIIFFIVIGGGILGGLVYFNIIDISVVNEALDLIGLDKNYAEDMDDREKMLESYKVPDFDSKSYYANNSEIVSETNANDSDEVHTEAESSNVIGDRNFIEYPITTEYSMDGTYYEAVNISNTSIEKHPMYQTYYIAENGDIWTIFLINGAIMANPVTYNIQSGLDIQVIVSEADTVTSYDSTANKFYETIPNESALIVISVDRIDAESLDQLTIGVIDRYVKSK